MRGRAGLSARLFAEPQDRRRDPSSEPFGPTFSRKREKDSVVPLMVLRTGPRVASHIHACAGAKAKQGQGRQKDKYRAHGAPPAGMIGP